MNEQLKTIFEDYELKASELTTIKNQLYFIMDNTTEIGENANDKSIKAYNYDRLQELLPSVADLLNYKIEEMHKNIDEYYSIKKETAI